MFRFVVKASIISACSSSSMVHVASLQQELLETKIESVDDKIFGLNEKIDCLVKKSKS